MRPFQSFLDQLTLALWPHPKDGAHPEVRADLVATIYAYRAIIVAAQVTIVTVSLVEAEIEHSLLLVALTLGLFLPVAVTRILIILAFDKAPPHSRRASAHLWQARWAIMALLQSSAMTAIFLVVIAQGSLPAIYMMALLALSNVIITATRAASIPYFAALQTMLLIGPFVVCFALSPELHAPIFAVMSVIFSGATLDAAKKIRREAQSSRAAFYEAEERARHDSLTGLLNRKAFTATLDARLAAGNPAALLFIDLDRFKAINDTQGHEAGDQLLLMIAETLERIVSTHAGTLARAGGDEFLVMTPGDPAPLAREIQTALASPFALPSGDVIIACSIGVNTTQMSSTSAELVRLADIALFHAKKQRNAIRTFDAAMDRDLTRLRQTESRLRHALQIGLIKPSYQPVVAVRTGEITAAEALARWTDDELGAVPPSVFVAIAESIGLIETLGEQILATACHDAAEWAPAIVVAVNVSPIQLKNPIRLRSAVIRALAESGLAPERLELEITESAMIENLDAARAVINDLVKLGVKIALDDFGSGYSSLSYLQNIPFSKIKIDRSLMEAAIQHEVQEVILRLVCQVAARLHSDVVAEGIETPFQEQAMTALGVTHLQGFFFGRPDADVSRFKTRPPGMRTIVELVAPLELIALPQENQPRAEMRS